MLLVDVLLPLNSLSGVQYLGAWAEIVQDLEKLHKHGFLHRDISSATLMYRKSDGRIQGVLTDFDLATSSHVNYLPHLLHRTGTTPFLAYELLSSFEYVPHLFRRDLESALYVLIWDAVDNVTPEASAANKCLRTWLDPTMSGSAKGSLCTCLREPTLPIGRGISLGELDPIKILLVRIASQIVLGYGQLFAWYAFSPEKLRTELEGEEKKDWEDLWGYFVPEVMVQKFQDLKQAFPQPHQCEPNG
ncbi:hypothetical protein BOTBODRAFT_190567 [Botryobasidium botryosum FD-172 SS1]|uniref:Protein kinase domain-containing protein n=1 Tax=Botryobasidium botryosum (strain FD-172 SS1) TaxID=930990 RepID=A0A067M692_BOTB1|nr:hypothetical protein BOTBODRAFT_190567 [Botryobasidium botryosum FD-172 SS1]